MKRFYLQKIKNSKPKINDQIYYMSDDIMYKFADLNHIDKIKIKNLLRLANEFVQPSELLKSLGLFDANLGNAIAVLEKEFFNNPNKIKKIIDSNNIDDIKNLLFKNKKN
jgi:hypothetical protein